MFRTFSTSHCRRALRAAPLGLLVLAAGCTEPLDFDLRSLGNGFDTTGAVQQLATRPAPDARGVISYPGYQVAVAQPGDTVTVMAARLGLNAAELAAYNGVDATVPLRSGEVIALPSRVSEPSAATGAITSGPLGAPGGLDVSTLAENAINNRPNATTPVIQSGVEPIRHRVVRGETAFSIARQYSVPVESLAEWNGLGPEFTVREGQFLLIPPPEAGAPLTITLPPAVSEPGAGTDTPTPPSAADPLPVDEDLSPTPEPPVEAPDIGADTTVSDAPMVVPVQGSIIRGYAPGRNEGIDIGAPAGDPVVAAADGTVAAITEDTNGVAILVIRHEDNVLTVYTFIDDLRVSPNQAVTQGQRVASVREGSPSFVHFEVRRGVDSVDPALFLE